MTGPLVTILPFGTFDIDVPLVIVGGGACGLIAALTARDAGIDVVVLEAGATCHGSSGMSLGAVCAAGTAAQRHHAIADDAEVFLADIVAKTRGTADPRLARLIANQSGPAIDWLAQRHDVVFDLDLAWKPAFGHRRQRMHTVSGRSGVDMMGKLEAAARRAAITIVNDAHVEILNATCGEAIDGVTFRRPDGTVERIGCQALILATCGFGGNHELVARYIPAMRDARYFGWEHNRGDALAWGAALGAATADLDAYQGLGLLAEPHGIDVSPKILIEGGIQINTWGRRFSDELGDVSGQGAVVIAQPGGIAWVVYDERIHLTCRDLPQYEVLMALGAMRTGKNVGDIARAIDVPADVLTATLHEIDVLAGRSDRFGRVFAGPPLTAPYHALRVTGALFHTQGGLVVDDEARVLRVDGSRLPNLFAGGGAARSISGTGPSGYLPGMGLCMAITLGRLAGGSAAQLIRKRAAAAF